MDKGCSCNSLTNPSTVFPSKTERCSRGTLPSEWKMVGLYLDILKHIVLNLKVQLSSFSTFSLHLIISNTTVQFDSDLLQHLFIQFTVGLPFLLNQIMEDVAQMTSYINTVTHSYTGRAHMCWARGTREPA